MKRTFPLSVWTGLIIFLCCTCSIAFSPPPPPPPLPPPVPKCTLPQFQCGLSCCCNPGEVCCANVNFCGCLAAGSVCGAPPPPPPTPPPSITSAGSASGTVGQAFSYNITAAQ